MARLNAALFLLPFCGVAGDATCEASSHGCVSDEITLLQARRMTTKGGDEAEPARNVPEPSYSVSAAGNICYDSHDLLFRIPPIGVWTSWSDITLEQCYEQCAATEGCNHFSYKSGACMGCTTVVNSQDGPVTYFMNGFVTYDMPFQLETQCLGTYQAEDATLSGAIAPRSPYHQGFTGSSYVDYGDNSGAYIEWTLSGCSGGDASASFRYANKNYNRPLQVLVNDEEVEASLSFGPTGSWNQWEVSTLRVTLSAGINVVRLVTIGWSGPNMDSLIIGAVDAFGYERVNGKYLAGYADGDSNTRSLADSMARCRELGSLCGGITCSSENQCTVRAGTTPQTSPHGEFSLVKDLGYSRVNGMYLSGYADGDSNRRSSEASMARCTQLGSLCGGITCSSESQCTVRAGTTPQTSPHGEFSLVKDPGYSRVNGMYLAGYADGDSNRRSSEGSMARCTQLGSLCGGITCSSESQCTVRAGTTPQTSPHGEFSLVKGA